MITSASVTALMTKSPCAQRLINPYGFNRSLHFRSVLLSVDRTSIAITRSVLELEHDRHQHPCGNGLGALRAGTKRQSLTVFSAASSSRAEPLLVLHLESWARPADRQRTRRITLPSSPIRRAAGGYAGGGLFQVPAIEAGRYHWHGLGDDRSRAGGGGATTAAVSNLAGSGDGDGGGGSVIPASAGVVITGAT
jgi:hypothetical protein